MGIILFSLRYSAKAICKLCYKMIVIKITVNVLSHNGYLIISVVFFFFFSLGKGQKLCEIERIHFFLSKKKTDELRNLHKLLYNRPGTVKTFFWYL